VIGTLKLHRKSSTKWDIKPLDRVRTKGEKDEVYREELENLKETYAETKQDILHQEDGILYRKLKLWVP
jgi:hypothetical protein